MRFLSHKHILLLVPLARHISDILKQSYILTAHLAGARVTSSQSSPKAFTDHADQRSPRYSLSILLTQPIFANIPQRLRRNSLPDLYKTRIPQVQCNNQQQHRGPSLKQAPGAQPYTLYTTTDPVFMEGEEIVHRMIPGGEGKGLQ